MNKLRAVTLPALLLFAAAYFWVAAVGSGGSVVSTTACFVLAYIAGLTASKGEPHER